MYRHVRESEGVVQQTRAQGRCYKSRVSVLSSASYFCWINVFPCLSPRPPSASFCFFCFLRREEARKIQTFNSSNEIWIFWRQALPG